MDDKELMVFSENEKSDNKQKKIKKQYEQVIVSAEDFIIDENNVLTAILFKRIKINKAVNISDTTASRLNYSTISCHHGNRIHIYTAVGKANKAENIKIIYKNKNKVEIVYE